MKGLLHPYQARIWNDRSRVVVVKKSRRIGGSFTVIGKGLQNAIRPDGRSVYYMSYTERAAREMMVTVERWADMYESTLAGTGRSIWRWGDKARALSATRAQFWNGRKFEILSGNPEGLRGPPDRPEYIVDEMELHPDPEAIMKAATPILMNGTSAITFMSTVRGEGPFWKLCEEIKEGRKPYSLHEIDFDLALEEGFYERVVVDVLRDPFTDDVLPVDDPELAEKLGVPCEPGARQRYREQMVASVDDPQEELFCIPRRSADQYFSEAMVRRCMADGHRVVRWEAPDGWLFRDEDLRRRDIRAFCEAHMSVLDGHRRIPPRRWYHGLDFARSSDRSVMGWGYPVDGKIRVPLVLELGNCPTDDQRFFWDEVRRRISGPLVRAAVDMGGPGRDMADHVLREMGEDSVDATMTNPAWFRAWMPKLRKRVESQTIELPDDHFLVQDACVIRLIDGVPRVPRSRTKMPSSGKGKGGRFRHADTTVMLALLTHAARDAANDGSGYSVTTDDDIDFEDGMVM